MEEMPDTGKNITQLDKVTALIDLGNNVPKFLSTVDNWYDVLFLYAGFKKKGFFLKFRNGYRVKIKSIDDLLHIVDRAEVQKDLIKSFEIPFEAKDNVVSFKFTGKKLHFYYDTEKQLLNTIASIRDIYFKDEYARLNVKGKVVVDIGAHIADTAIYFALKGAAHVYCFEPYPHSYRIAKKNVKLNGLEDRITVFNEACGAKESSIVLDPHYGSVSGDDLKKFKKGQRIRIETLSNIVNRLKMKNPVLKMDCEGYEYGIVLGTKSKVLRLFDQIILEYHYGYLNLEKKLRSDGFRVWHSGPKKTINCFARSWKMTNGLVFAENPDI